jgi:hypothetical protein
MNPYICFLYLKDVSCALSAGVNGRTPTWILLGAEPQPVGGGILGLLNLFKQLKTPPEYTRNHQSIGNKSATLLTEPGINPPKVQASRFILRAYALPLCISATFKGSFTATR